MLEERGALVDGNLADMRFLVSKKQSTHDSEEVLVQTSTTDPSIQGSKNLHHDIAIQGSET